MLPKKPYFLLPSKHHHAHTIRSFASASASSSGGVSLYLQRAKLIDSLRLRLRLHDPSSPFPLPSSPLLDSFVAARALRSAPSPESALSLLRSLLSLPSFSSSPHPSLPPLLRLRHLVSSGDLPSALHTFSSLRSHHRHPCTESYNLIISLHAAAADHSSALSTFSLLLADGAIPNSRTYTVLIDHLLRANKADAALQLFHLLPSIRIRRTCRQYDALARAFSSSARFDRLLILIQQMNADGVLPGRPTLAAIANLRAAGFVSETEEFVAELSPDRRIGYAVDCAEEEEEEEEEGDRSVKLKPWMDPAALARALEGWDPKDVALLEAAGFVWSTRLVCKLLRSFRTAKTAWEFFCWVAYQPGGFAHDRHTVSRMISILAGGGRVELVERLLNKLQSEGILLPFATVRLIIDFYGISKKADAAIRVYRIAASICGPLSRLNLMLLSSSLLRAVVKSGKGDDAMALLEEMMAEGIVLDIQAFSGMMEYFAGEGDLKSVHRLLGMAKQCGLKPDAFMYRVMIRGYCRQERAVLALKVFDEMLSSGVVPSGGTKGILVKSLWREGKLREAAMVEERCEDMGELPAAEMGHAWTVSAADFDRVRGIYSGGFGESGG